MHQRVSKSCYRVKNQGLKLSSVTLALVCNLLINQHCTTSFNKLRDFVPNSPFSSIQQCLDLLVTMSQCAFGSELHQELAHLAYLLAGLVFVLRLGGKRHKEKEGCWKSTASKYSCTHDVWAARWRTPCRSHTDMIENIILPIQQKCVLSCY